MEEVIVGVVGTLQLTCSVPHEGASTAWTSDGGLPYEYLRFIDKSPVADLKDLNLSTDVELLEDYREEACWCSRRTGRSTTPSSAIPVSSFPRRRRTGKWVSNLGLFTKIHKLFYRAGGIPARFFLFIENMGRKLKQKCYRKGTKKYSLCRTGKMTTSSSRRGVEILNFS